MTISVTLQLIVTLDSIRNSCDVLLHYTFGEYVVLPVFHFSGDFPILPLVGLRDSEAAAGAIVAPSPAERSVIENCLLQPRCLRHANPLSGQSLQTAA